MIDEKKLLETFEDMALSWGERHDKESKYRRFDMEEIERIINNQPKVVKKDLEIGKIRELVKNLRWYGSYADSADKKLMYEAADIIEKNLLENRF